MIRTPIFVILAVSTFGLAADAQRYGRTEMPIVNGVKATDDQVLSTVAIVDANTGQVFCTGTLVSPSVVVSASHCFVTQDEETDEIIGTSQPEEVMIVVDSLEPTQSADEERYDVLSIAVHPNYPNPNSATDDPAGLKTDNDIAVVVLDGEVSQLDPAPILPMSQVDSVLPADTTIVITGFGKTDPNTEEGGVLHIAETRFRRHNSTEYLASGEADSCQGDSGGPGYVESGDTFFLIGASARGTEADGAAVCGDGGINTLVPAYASWIAEQAGDAWDPPAQPATGVPNPQPNTPTNSVADDESGDCSAGGNRPKTPWMMALMLGLLFVLRFAGSAPHRVPRQAATRRT